MNSHALSFMPEPAPMPQVADDLPERVLAGDERALALVSRWISETLVSPRFWRLRPQWRDLHQEAMLGILKSLRVRQFDPSRDFRAYVRGVGRNTAMYALRRDASRRNVAALMAHAPAARDPRDAMDLVLLVRRLLDLATPLCRGIMRAYFLEDQDYEDLAREEQVPVGTIKSRLSRCLDKAHALLEGTIE